MSTGVLDRQTELAAHPGFWFAVRRSSPSAPWVKPLPYLGKAGAGA